MMRRRLAWLFAVRLAALLAGLVLGGCAAGKRPVVAAVSAERPRASPQPAAAGSFVCDRERERSSEAPRRLSAREYRNTLADLFAFDTALHALPRSVAALLQQLPRDGAAASVFENLDGRLGQRHVDTYLAVAETVGRALANDAAALAALAGDCALGSELDVGCFRNFLESFGARVFRRPLSSDELARFDQPSRGDTAPRLAYARALSDLLAAPEFLYHLELGRVGAESATPLHEPREPSSYELAARLAYHFWQTMPDQALFEAARSGALETAAGYQRELVRVTAQRRARATWYRFFRQWLGLEDFGGFAFDQPFTSFAGNLKVTDELYTDAVLELEALVGYYTFDTPGSFADLLTSDRVLTRSPRLAELYRVEPWDGRSQPLRFRRGERGGLLTRAALLISASHATNPFRRGAFVLRRLLCESMEPPVQRPPEALAVPAFDAQATTRQRYENKVGAWECRGCHQLFSPFGYVLERYDALGRYREEERLFDDLGRHHGRLPLDGRARIVVDGRPRKVSDPIALSKALAESRQASECFVRQYFRFTFRRPETPADHCTLQEMHDALVRGGLRALQSSVAWTAAFRGESRSGQPRREEPGASAASLERGP